MGFQCFASFMCRCESGPYFELWAQLTTGSTISIIDMTRGVGEAVNSLAVFTIADVYAGPSYTCAMAREDSLFVLKQNSIATPSALSVVCYDRESGDVLWQQTDSTEVGSGSPSAGFNTGGNGSVYANGGNDGFSVLYLVCVNETQVWNMNGGRLFEAAGVSDTIVPNSASDPDDGDLAAWVITRFASHDFPECLVLRRRFGNVLITYGGYVQISFGVTPQYRHSFPTTFDEVLEVGTGSFNPTTGLADGVDVIWDRSTGRSTTLFSVTTSTTQPPDPIPNLSVTTGALSVVNVPRFFSSYKGNYAASFRYSEVSPGGSPGSASLLIINGTEAWSHSGSGSQVDSLAWVMDAKSGMASVIATYTESAGPFGAQNRYVAGYDSGGDELWKQTIPRPAYVLSTNDTWAMVMLTINVATENAPDGRNWSGATITGSPSNQLRLWMVKLDGSEWEPCRTQFTETTWGNLSAFAPAVAAIRPAPYVFSYDLVKSVDHPFGPPADTYGTTPP